MTDYEKSIIAKYEQAQTRWWLLSPSELASLENEARKIYAKYERG